MGCDSSKCAAGNKCLELNGQTECRKTCTSNSDPATSCPFGYTCAMPSTGGEAFCVADQVFGDDGKPIKKAEGQWGTPCIPTNGFSSPDCDEAQAFYCYGVSPTDGDAYCTRYACETDSNCGAGFWCATINVAPNVQRKKRTVGEVEKVCLRREYCATCKDDVDCPSLGGRAQHCVADVDGNRFCTTECERSANCPNEAACEEIKRPDGSTMDVCYPRAGRCVGKGELCDPCLSDADCGDDGICLKSEYSTERFCAKKSSTPCSGSFGDCPKNVNILGEDIPVSCTQVGGDLPPSYCVGLVEFGEPRCGTDRTQPCYTIGCYSPKR